jgi:hypothetical protein
LILNPIGVSISAGQRVGLPRSFANDLETLSPARTPDGP